MSYRECNAKSKRTGQKCTARAMNGSEKCYHHGGATPRGFDLPQTKTGAHSKYLPTKLLTIYDDVRGDPELTDIRSKIALVETLMNFKLKTLLDDDGERHGDSFEVWKKLKTLVADCRKAYKSESYASLEEALDKMEDIANARLFRYETEAEIKADVEQWRKLVETEQKITLQGERAISAESVMLLMAQVLDVIKSVVTDDRQRFAIASGLQQLISVGQSAQESD